MIIEGMTAQLDGCAALTQLGVIRVHGEDTSSFLQGQLTQDIALMANAQARFAAYCNAKGRMLASFVVLKLSQDEVLLVCSRDLVAPMVKRLSMYVLRAKTRVQDASLAFTVVGLVGGAVARVAGADAPPWSRVDLGPAMLVHLYPGAGLSRALWIAPALTPPPAVATLAPGEWELCEVQSAVATLVAATSEAFMPQMLNFESVGGVNFKKGCYPGQEVVARSQFRGTLKRRAFLVSAAEPMAVGDELFMPQEPDEPCATVVQAAANLQGGYDALVSGQIAAIQLPQLHLGSVLGPVARPRPAPYPLLADI